MSAISTPASTTATTTVATTVATTQAHVKSTNSVPPKLSVKQRFINATLSALQNMNSDMRCRLESSKKDPAQLEKGYFYAWDYVKAHTEAHQKLDATKFESEFGNSSLQKCFDTKKVTKPIGTVNRTHIEFVIKDDIEPSEALTCLGDSLLFIDCHTACTIAQYKGLHAVFGREKFNAFFHSKSRCPLRFGKLTEPLVFFQAIPKNASNSPADVKQGQWVYFHNVKGDPTTKKPSYQDKHGNRTSRGYNAFCFSERTKESLPKFIAFGFPKEEAMTPGEITKNLLQSYNGATSNEELEQLDKKFGKDSNTRLDSSPLRGHQYSLMEFMRFGGGTMDPLIRDYNFKLIEELAAFSVKKACKHLEKYKIK